MQVLFSAYLSGVIRSSDCVRSVFPLLHKHRALHTSAETKTLQSVGGKEERGGRKWKDGRGVERSQCRRKETDGWEDM